ncbi:MAG TPA: Ig-like domain-containing protein [Longimicrobiaceae bacterium]|nr:Ig-like domain-containing protein [Longimicrobiaceae bacterium]
MSTHRHPRRARPGGPAFAVAALLALPLAGCDNPFGSDAGGSTPVLALTSPAPGQVVDADSVVVEGTAIDNRSVERVTYRLNGGAELAAQVAPGPQVTFRFVVRELKLGANELEVMAYDDGERVATRKLALATRDAAAPTVQLRTPSENELVPRDSVVIAGTAADERRVVSLAYALDGGAEQPVTVAPGRQAAFSLVLKGTAPGEHTVVLTARDEAGNTGSRTVRFTTSSVRVTINLPRPDTTVTAFALYVSGQMQGPVLPSHVSYSVNGGPEARSRWMSAVYTTTGVPGVYQWWGVVDSLPQGPATIRVFANDAQGRELGVGSVTVDVSVPVKQYALTYLGTLRGSDSRGAALNEKGQAVGTWSDGGPAGHAWAWDGARMIDLEAETGWTASAAAGINEGGEVVGTFTGAADACTRSFHYRIGQDARPRRLVEDCDHRAVDVNDAGRVLVSAPAVDPSVGTEGYLLDGQTRRRLVPHGSTFTQYFLRLNNRDEALGAVYHSFYTIAPAVFTTTGAPALTGVCVPADLDDTGGVAIVSGCRSTQLGGNGTAAGRQLANPGVPNPYSQVNPAGMNNRGEAVGMYLLSSRMDAAGADRIVQRPFFWDGARSHDVSVADADWRVDGVVDVNDAGVILAHAVNARTGQKGAVLLTPRS